MGWSYHKSINLGICKLNFSKSGVSVSFGVKGLRVSLGPKGLQFNAGKGGVRYNKTVSSKKLKSAVKTGLKAVKKK